MVKCWVSHLELYIEVNLGVMKYKDNSYQISLVRARNMATLRMWVKIWKNKHFDIHWKHRVDLR